MVESFADVIFEDNSVGDASVDSNVDKSLSVSSDTMFEDISCGDVSVTDPTSDIVLKMTLLEMLLWRMREPKGWVEGNHLLAHLTCEK